MSSVKTPPPPRRHAAIDEIDRIAGAIKTTHPDFRYQPIAEPEESGNGGLVRWVSGRPGAEAALIKKRNIENLSTIQEKSDYLLGQRGNGLSAIHEFGSITRSPVHRAIELSHPLNGRLGKCF